MNDLTALCFSAMHRVTAQHPGAVSQVAELLPFAVKQGAQENPEGSLLLPSQNVSNKPPHLRQPFGSSSCAALRVHLDAAEQAMLRTRSSAGILRASSGSSRRSDANAGLQAAASNHLHYLLTNQAVFCGTLCKDFSLSTSSAFSSGMSDLFLDWRQLRAETLQGQELCFRKWGQDLLADSLLGVRRKFYEQDCNHATNGGRGGGARGRTSCTANLPTKCRTSTRTTPTTRSLRFRQPLLSVADLVLRRNRKRLELGAYSSLVRELQRVEFCGARHGRERNHDEEDLQHASIYSSCSSIPSEDGKKMSANKKANDRLVADQFADIAFDPSKISFTKLPVVPGVGPPLPQEATTAFSDKATRQVAISCSSCDQDEEMGVLTADNSARAQEEVDPQGGGRKTSKHINYPAPAQTNIEDVLGGCSSYAASQVKRDEPVEQRVLHRWRLDVDMDDVREKSSSCAKNANQAQQNAPADTTSKARIVRETAVLDQHSARSGPNARTGIQSFPPHDSRTAHLYSNHFAAPLDRCRAQLLIADAYLANCTATAPVFSRTTSRRATDRTGNKQFSADHGRSTFYFERGVVEKAYKDENHLSTSPPASPLVLAAVACAKALTLAEQNELGVRTRNSVLARIAHVHLCLQDYEAAWRILMLEVVGRVGGGELCSSEGNLVQFSRSRTATSQGVGKMQKHSTGLLLADEAAEQQQEEQDHELQAYLAELRAELFQAMHKKLRRHGRPRSRKQRAALLASEMNKEDQKEHETFLGVGDFDCSTTTDESSEFGQDHDSDDFPSTEHTRRYFKNKNSKKNYNNSGKEKSKIVRRKRVIGPDLQTRVIRLEVASRPAARGATQDPRNGEASANRKESPGPPPAPPRQAGVDLQQDITTSSQELRAQQAVLEAPRTTTSTVSPTATTTCSFSEEARVFYLAALKCHVRVGKNVRKIVQIGTKLAELCDKAGETASRDFFAKLVKEVYSCCTSDFSNRAMSSVSVANTSATRSQTQNPKCNLLQAVLRKHLEALDAL
ncbi:unnamed protein product [Amoebophrya sp. A120]|nr:unnamed protein product [Amoebophrya sp. A120]|eukprot:GSA120T00007451001.1